MEGDKFLIGHHAKTIYGFSLKTIKSIGRQFLIERLIHNMEFKDHYQNSKEKNPEIIETIENSYKVNRCVYLSLFQTCLKAFLSIYTLSILMRYENLIVT